MQAARGAASTAKSAMISAPIAIWLIGSTTRGVPGAQSRHRCAARYALAGSPRSAGARPAQAARSRQTDGEDHGGHGRWSRDPARIASPSISASSVRLRRPRFARTGSAARRSRQAPRPEAVRASRRCGGSDERGERARGAMRTERGDLAIARRPVGAPRPAPDRRSSAPRDDNQQQSRAQRRQPRDPPAAASSGVTSIGSHSSLRFGRHAQLVNSQAWSDSSIAPPWCAAPRATGTRRAASRSECDRHYERRPA